MHIVAAIALILGFCLLLLFGLISVLQDLFARSVHQYPSVPVPEPVSRHEHQAAGLSQTSQTTG